MKIRKLCLRGKSNKSFRTKTVLYILNYLVSSPQICTLCLFSNASSSLLQLVTMIPWPLSPVEESHCLQYDKLAPHKQWPWMSPKKDRVLKDQGTGKIVIPSSQRFLEEWTISSGRLLNDNSSQMSRADVPLYKPLIRPLKNITLRKAMQSGKGF